MAYTKLITPPATEPITLVQAKANLRVDHTDDDTRITRHITEAREWVEKRIQHKIAGATYEQAFDAFPDGNIEITTLPVVSISSVKYDDVDDVEQAIDAGDYTLDGALIVPDESWPTAYDKINSVRVRFVVGYSAANLIPYPVVAAMYLKLQELYDGEDADRAIHNMLTNYYTMVA